MQKQYKIKVDITKKYAMPAFEVNTNDLKSIRLSIEVLNGASPLDLKDKTARIAIRKPDNNIVFQDCTITDAANGQVDVILENQAYIIPGTHTAEIMCYKGNDVVAVSGTFSYKSSKGIMNDEAVESKSEFTAINRTIEEAERILEDLRENGGGVGVDEQARQGIQDVTARLADTAKKTELEVERQRISQLQTIPEGGTTADAALNDIKVAADGLVYNTPGEAVRNQIGKLTSVTDMLVQVKEVSENIINQSEIISGKQVSGSNGNESSNSNYAVTGFIPVKKGWKLYGYVAPNTATFAAVGYDKDKKFLMNIVSLPDYVGDTTTRRWSATMTFDGFIRCNLPIGNISTAMLKVNLEYPANASYIGYQMPYSKRTSDFLLPVNATTIKYQDNPVFQVRNGLFDKNKSVDGYISWTNGNINSSTVYKTTDFIPVEKNTDYTIQSAFRYFLAYDSNKQPIADSYLQTVTNNHTFNTGNNIGFIRFSYYAHSEQYAYITKGNSPAFDIQKGTVSLETDNKLFGKKLISLGDSIMAGDGNGGWGIGDIVSAKNSMYHADYSRGGATIGLRDEFVNADSEDQKRLNIQHQVDSAIAGNTDTNYILVNGQTNDIDKANIIPIGAITDKFDGSYDLRTFAGGLESIFYKLKSAFPLAKIVYVCVHAQGSRTLNAQTTRVNLAKQICQKWGVKVADIFGEGTMNTFLSQYVPYTNNGDKTHPNMEGYNRFYTPIIENSMKAIS